MPKPSSQAPIEHVSKAAPKLRITFESFEIAATIDDPIVAAELRQQFSDVAQDAVWALTDAVNERRGTITTTPGEEIAIEPPSDIHS